MTINLHLWTPNVAFLLLTLTGFVVTGCNKPVQPDPRQYLKDTLGQDVLIESDMIDRILNAKSDEERRHLIAKFEKIPVKFHPFYSRWLAIHKIDPYACWNDQGYNESACDLPREIQWLEVTNYGVSDIENGGVHQFFGNGTGTFAPEMALWFDEAGLPEAARILRQAIAVFGPEFPRSQAQRREILDAFPGAYEADRAEWDPFSEMDGPFYDALPKDKLNDTFDAACDRWLRERCGIQRLSDPPPKTARQ